MENAVTYICPVYLHPPCIHFIKFWFFQIQNSNKEEYEQKLANTKLLKRFRLLEGYIVTNKIGDISYNLRMLQKLNDIVQERIHIWYRTINLGCSN